MEFNLLTILNTIGGLGFFIYGMKVMSEGIQKLAGDKLRSILSVMTSNRVLGVITGFFITCLIQSSSATTVMLVSFVNAGLISLIESIGVIMGANIGTTFTGWLVTLFGFKVKIAHFAYPIIGIGMPLMFTKSDKLKNLGEFLIGFALLFLGLNYLKELFSNISNEQLEFLIPYSQHGIWSTLLFVLVGTVLTVIVQSSSAAMAITLLLVNQGAIPLTVGAAIILGENIGTTITANLAAAVANIHAKRAARAHLIFNLFGVVWMLVLFTPFIALIERAYGPIQDFLGSINPDLVKDGDTALKLSLFHSIFNLINTLVLIGFIGLIAKIVKKMVPNKGFDEESFELKYIDNTAISTSELSLEKARKELHKNLEVAMKMSTYTRELVNTTDYSDYSDLLDKIRLNEEVSDKLEEKVSYFLSKMAKHDMSESAMRRLRNFLSVSADVEKIGDIYFSISLSLKKKKEKKVWFSPEQRSHLNKLFELLDEAYKTVGDNLSHSSKEDVSMEGVKVLEKRINDYCDSIHKEHVKSMEDENYNYQGGLYYKEVFNACDKIGDYIVSINEALAGKKEVYED